MIRITTVVALVLFGSPALSQVQDGTNGEGTLFLTVYDPGRGETYNVDLGRSMTDFLRNPGDWAAIGRSVPVPAELEEWVFASPDIEAILWDIGAVNYAFSPELADPLGVLITATDTPQTPQGFSSFTSIAGNMQAYVAGVNASINDNGGIATAGPGHFADIGTWNRNVGGTLFGTSEFYATTGASLRDSLTLYFIVADLAAGTSGDYYVVEVASLKLPIIPIPAPIVLLLSALVGFAGFARRRRLRV